MPSILNLHAIEESVYAVTVAFLDDTSAAVTPSAATWTLTDTAGTVVNSRSAVAISPLSTSATIVLSGNDLALSSTLRGTTRVLLVEYTYTSSLGSNLPGKDEVVFVIDSLVGVS
jgi:hypothetical protein